MAQTQPVLREVYETRGINYTIFVESSGRKFYGKWICQADGQKGGSSGLFETPESALRAAKTNADVNAGFMQLAQNGEITE